MVEKFKLYIYMYNSDFCFYICTEKLREKKMDYSLFKKERAKISETREKESFIFKTNRNFKGR